MPGYDTHYIFGVHSYRRMPDSDVKKSISNQRNAYRLGLLGPDIFFYYATEIIAVRKNIGSLMHTSKTDEFFKHCLEYTNLAIGHAKDISVAYIAGFLSHYTLDCMVHPYVYWMTDYNNKGKDYLEKHFSLETDIDISLIRTYLGVTPKDFFRNSQITLNSYEKFIISDLLHYAIRKTYTNSRITRSGIKAAIISLQKEYKILKIVSSTMKDAIGTIETAFIGQKYIAPLIPGGNEPKSKDPLNLEHSIWFNPWNTAIYSTKSIPDLLNDSRERFMLFILLFDNFLLDSNKKASMELFLRGVGCKSYHSGLHYKIPS